MKTVTLTFNSKKIMMDVALRDLFLGQIDDPNILTAQQLSDIIVNRFGLTLDLVKSADFNYVSGVMRHKVAVYKAGEEILQKFEEQGLLTDVIKEGFLRQLLIHDLSKFGAKESTGYMGYNFQDKTQNTPEATAAFMEAWRHHYTTNEHHPEYWMQLDKSALVTLQDMPGAYILEMLADWVGAGRTYGQSAGEWLPLNLHNFSFNEKTATVVQDMLKKILNIETEMQTRFIFTAFKYLKVKQITKTE